MKYLGYIIALVTITSSQAIAQDGEGLFSAKCAVCHIIGKNSTGPNLQGVKQKWEDAGELEFIYEWVRNPQTLVASGKSKMATVAESFSASAMTPQELSNEEIDAVLSYIDNYVPPAKVEPPTPNGDPVVVVVPNYKKNLTIFYFLLIALGIQALAILVLSNSTRMLVKMEKLKSENAKNAVKTIAIILGVTGCIALGNASYAITFVAAGEDPTMPWLLVEDSDLYVLVGINIAMLFLVLHFKGLFMDIARTYRPELVKKVSKRKQRNMNKVLTDAVPIEEEHTILLHHEYDGIQELDNNLPPWWVWGFYATIVFAVFYIFHYHILKTGDLQIAGYEKEVAAAEIEKQAYLEKMAMNVDENTATLMTEASDLSTGSALFQANCISCHNNDGGGNQIGPNLTDKNWIYGFDIKEVFASIKYGRPAGMPEHASKLNPVQIQQVASYVLSLPEVDGKAAQGDILEP